MSEAQTGSDSQVKTVSLEEHETVKKELDKLKTIFEERQTKALKKEDVLKKDELLKALGIEKDPEKSEIELISEKLNNTNQSIEELKKALDAEKAEKEQAKQAAVKLQREVELKELADEMGINKKLALKLADVNAEDLKAELAKIAEEYPEIKIVKNVGAGTNPVNGNKPEDIKAEFEKLDAQPSLTREEQKRFNQLATKLKEQK